MRTSHEIILITPRVADARKHAQSSEDIAAQTDVYLGKGGTIHEIPPGVSGDTYRHQQPRASGLSVEEVAGMAKVSPTVAAKDAYSKRLPNHTVNGVKYIDPKDVPNYIDYCNRRKKSQSEKRGSK